MEVLRELTPPSLNNQSVEVSKKIDGEGPIRRNARLPDRLVEEPFADTPTLYHLFRRAVKFYGDRPCLGYRPVTGPAPPVTDKAARGPADNRPRGPYQWMSYKEVGQKVDQFGSYLRSKGLERGDKVGLYSKNKPEWTMTEHACNAHALITVAIYDTFGPESVEYVINHSELKLVVASPECISKVLKAAPSCPNMKTIVQIGESLDKADDEKIAAEVKAAGLDFITFDEALAEGKANPVDHAPPHRDSLAVIMYTSGTTGNPKGVMHKHQNLVATATAVASCLGGITCEDVYISYLPLAHILEREAVIAILMNGGSVGFYQGEILKLTEDIGALRPTLMCGVPRVFDRIYSRIKDKVAKASGIKQYLFNWGYQTKKANGQSWFWDALVFGNMKAVLGGRVRMVVSGGAPLSAETQEFLRICFSCPVVQGYGLTETCAAGCVTLPEDPNVGHTGPPVCCAEIKLVDIPEMNYLSTMDPPCGEVCIRGPCVSSGYYKDEEKTKADFDEDGWFHTGDVGKWNANGTLSIIDRKKNIFKLAQGEYVAAEKLELVYGQSNFVGQIFVYGDSYKTVLVAVVVPEREALTAAAKDAGIQFESFEELCQTDAAKKIILDDLAKLGKANKVQGFEMIKAVVMHPNEFTVDDDLVTPSMKLKRPQLKKRFQDPIDSLYSTLN